MKLSAVLPALLVIVFVFVFANAGYACVCGVDETTPVKMQVNTAKAGAHSVFAGEVLKITESKDRNTLFVTIRVEALWKGTKTGQKVITITPSETCSYTFYVGEKYLVYAYKYEGAERAGLCSRTKLLAGAAEDISYLGKKLKK